MEEDEEGVTALTKAGSSTPRHTRDTTYKEKERRQGRLGTNSQPDRIYSKKINLQKLINSDMHTDMWQGAQTQQAGPLQILCARGEGAEQ